MPTVLLTGAGGFIGGRLARHFQGRGADVVADVAQGRGGLRAGTTTQSLVCVADGRVPDVVVHAAGSGSVSQMAADPALRLSTDVASTLGVLEYLRSSAPHAHLVFLSSAAVYGNAPPQPQYEADAREPVSLYGVGKMQCEQLLRHYSRQFGLRTTAVRLFSVYGAGLRKQLLWDAMNKFAVGARGFFGTGQERRDWVHVDDVCQFIQLLVEAPATGGHSVFNCGGHAATTSDVLTCLAEQAGVESPQFSGQMRAGDPLALMADYSHARSTLGYAPEVGLIQGLSEYAAWFISGAPAMAVTDGERRP